MLGSWKVVTPVGMSASPQARTNQAAWRQPPFPVARVITRDHTVITCIHSTCVQLCIWALEGSSKQQRVMDSELKLPALPKRRNRQVQVIARFNLETNV